MATCCIPRDPLTWFIVRARRVLFSACTVALVSCGGGQSAPTAPVDSVGPTGADTTDGPSITLNPPTTVGESNRLEVTWQAQGDLTSFTVCVQRATGVGFETVDAIIGSNSAQFERGAAYRLDFPTARVRVRGCNDAGQCVESNEQPLLDPLLGGLAENTAQYGLSQVALSADGNTLAVFAGAGDPNNPTTPGTGAVIVFHRAEDGARGTGHSRPADRTGQ